MALYDVSTTEKKANPELLSGRGNIDEIKAVIPSDASASNQLVTESEISKTEKTLNIGGSDSAIVKIDVSVPFIAASYGKFTEIDFQVRSDNMRFFISANDGAYLVTAQHNHRSAGWVTGLYYLVNDSKSISLYVGILNYPADVGAKLVFNGLDGTEITEISTVSVLPSGYLSMNQFPVIYTADLTSTVTSGSTAPITSGGVYNALAYTPITNPSTSSLRGTSNTFNADTNTDLPTYNTGAGTLYLAMSGLGSYKIDISFNTNGIIKLDNAIGISDITGSVSNNVGTITTSNFTMTLTRISDAIRINCTRSGKAILNYMWI